jgi:hypothetical protein
VEITRQGHVIEPKESLGTLGDSIDPKESRRTLLDLRGTKVYISRAFP